MARDLLLVTGGTGAIGLPLVDALSRAGTDAVVLARARRGEMPGGIPFVAGDVTAGPSLGLDAATAGDLRRRLTAIVHAAALTRFDAVPEAARAVNVAGTGHVLAFAAQCRRLERVVALSTVYVAGRRTGRIEETELPHGAGFVNPYEASKHEAEIMLREAMPRLPVSVCRLSTAIGDSRSGHLDRLGAIHHAMRFLYHSLLPMMPGSDGSPVDLIATDYAVDAVRVLAGDRFAAGATWHVCAAGTALPQAELVDLIVAAFLRHRPAWRRRAIEKPAIVDLETFELFRRSVDAVADPALRASVAVLAPFAPQLAYPKTFDDAACRRILDAAGVERPSLHATLDRVVRHLVESNWTVGQEARAWQG